MEFQALILLSFLQTTFITLFLLMLHYARKSFGQIAFYMAIGALFVLIQFVSALQLKVFVNYPGLDFYIANSSMFLPLLSIIIVIYITEGTLEAQKIILGFLAFFCFYIYISYTISIFCEWKGYGVSQGPITSYFSYFLGVSIRNLIGALIALSIDLFMIPVIYQRFKNFGVGRFLAICASLLITQFIDSFISLTISYWSEPSSWQLQISSTYIARFVVTIWLSLVVYIYLALAEKEKEESDRKTFDIVLAFMGGYNRSKLLEKSITEWEDRYRLVVENASDMIIIANRHGVILDANETALNKLGYSKNDLLKKRFNNLSKAFTALPCLWEKIWFTLNGDSVKGTTLINKATLRTVDRKDLAVEIDFSLAIFSSLPVILIFCKDITAEITLKKEKEQLKEQLYHTQRVESLGRLAGGVSHEFNNVLHAMQGHIDLVLLFNKIEDENVKKHLESVDGLINKASTITSQLLGFARKRAFTQNTINLKNVLQETKDIFLPLSKSDIRLDIEDFDQECLVQGDFIQLQQVFLNIFINSMDALSEVEREEKIIKVRLIKNKKRFKDWKPVKVTDNPNDFHSLIIYDNGCGMPKEIASKIFEPFYTTKEVGKGTGMGLAMAYGEIRQHGGSISVVSRKNVGTRFYIHLPIYNEIINEKDK